MRLTLAKEDDTVANSHARGPHEARVGINQVTLEINADFACPMLSPDLSETGWVSAGFRRSNFT